MWQLDAYYTDTSFVFGQPSHSPKSLLNLFEGGHFVAPSHSELDGHGGGTH